MPSLIAPRTSSLAAVAAILTSVQVMRTVVMRNRSVNLVMPSTCLAARVGLSNAPSGIRAIATAWVLSDVLLSQP